MSSSVVLEVRPPPDWSLPAAEPSPWPCPFCPAAIDTRRGLRAHLGQAHTLQQLAALIEQLVRLGVIKPKKKDDGSNKGDEDEDEVIEVEEEVEDTEVTERPNVRSRRQAKPQQQKHVFKCDVCDKVASSKASMKRHMMKVHGTDCASNVEYCQKCQ